MQKCLKNDYKFVQSKEFIMFSTLGPLPMDIVYVSMYLYLNDNVGTWSILLVKRMRKKIVE